MPNASRLVSLISPKALSIACRRSHGMVNPAAAVGCLTLLSGETGCIYAAKGMS
jgi:hypothetical protein